MISDKDKPERVSGWVLAGVVFFHLLLLRAPAGILMTATIVLLAGAIMRARRIFPVRGCALSCRLRPAAAPTWWRVPWRNA